MAPRTQLNKAAWSWVERVTPEDVREEHVELAYRVNAPACRRGTCKKNCKGNPNCMVGIGEKAWLGEKIDDWDDPNWERRDENAFVGLTNLGATCYVNAFLQVWFHNLELRRSLYRCRRVAPRAQEEQSDDDGAYEPQSIWEHLQCLFALLQNSNRRHVDPSGLVAALGLDTGLQQDAQEFSKLFLTLLEDSLAQQTEAGLQKAIQKQFCGEFSYVTTCDRCGRVSPLPSTFYELELNIRGHGDLAECVREFLREEKLDGDNRYFCGSCGSKQSAARRIQLHGLPPTLNLQLMRFVFDRQTGHKKKLNTYVSFPELLDMGPFREGTAGGRRCLYELSAVLIHRGASAYSGHYVAHVKDARTGDWYEFNDDETERMKGNALRLGVDEDTMASQSNNNQSQNPTCNKGYHCSRDAYMLVYKALDEEQRDTVPEVPAVLQRLVERDNLKFEEQCVKMAVKRKQRADKRKDVKELYELLPAADGQPYEFVPLDWLRTWLDKSAATTEIDNSLFLCSHGKMHPDKIKEAKRVSLPATRLLYERYGGGPRLDAASLCKECVAERCRALRLKNQLAEDAKEVSRLVKEGTHRGGEGFWVGRASLRAWQRMALRQLEEGGERETKCGGDGQTDGHGVCGACSDSKEYFGPRLPEGSGDEGEEMMTFNEDVLCSHRTLSTLTEERRLVPSEAWSRLKAYFPGAPEFGRQQQPCSRCLSREREEKAVASDQQDQLSNLFAEKNRPRLTRWPLCTEVLYAVPARFVDEWRKFVRSPTRSPRVSSVDNDRLLCSHGGLTFTYDSLVDGGDARRNIALLWPDEWDAVNRLFAVDRPISIHRSTPDDDRAPPRYSTQPGLCHECCEGLLVQRRKRDLWEYARATIYVRKMKMVKQEATTASAASEPNATERNSTSSDVVEEEKDQPPKMVDGDDARGADFSESADMQVKRLKLDNGATTGIVPLGAPHFEANNNNDIDNGVQEATVRRRSTRNRKRAAGDKALTVRADQTLRELKVQIMSAFAVAPFDQNLSVDGQRLTDDSATLSGLGVTPCSTVVLTADKPVGGSYQYKMDRLYRTRMPEEGFKGTGLLGY